MQGLFCLWGLLRLARLELPLQAGFVLLISFHFFLRYQVLVICFFFGLV